MLPQLRKLEHAFGGRLVMIGVHSGKFIAERVTDNIRAAAGRLGVHHPVVNDRHFRIWRSFAVNAWPTITLIDAEGYVVAQQAGEIPGEALIPVVERLIAAGATGSGARGPEGEPPSPAVSSAVSSPLLSRSPRPAVDLTGHLRFPAKLAVSRDGALAIADTGNHRILRARPDADGMEGTVETVIGGGAPGFRDGPPRAALFHSPHGVAFLDDGALLVADTGNHAIRMVAADGTVTTAAGTGEQARRRSAPVEEGTARTADHSAGGGRAGEGNYTDGIDATGTQLNSPWDVAARDGIAWIAMAGWHQLWRFDLQTRRVAPWTGSGAEAIVDGPPRAAALAQPSGLALDGNRLYFADSESSAIRYADLRDGSVTTLVGTGLFDFGDRDGAGDQVRLQHPLAVAVHEGVLLIADTYNNRIKRLDPSTRTVETWLDADLHEPGGLALLPPHLYIADTNHHRVVVANLSTGAIATLDLIFP